EKDADKIIFVGDYFDTHEKINPLQQIDNFKKLLDYKKNHLEQIVLLFGNHDFHYLSTTHETYSGFKGFVKPEISSLLEKAIDADLMQMCFVYDRFLFVHAGVTKTWCQEKDVDVTKIEQELNYLLKWRPNTFCFNGWDMYGDDISQSPIWVRPKSLLKDKIDYTQVVGHTQVNKLELGHEII